MYRTRQATKRKRDHGPRGRAKWRTFVYMILLNVVVQEFKDISGNDNDDGYLHDGTKLRGY